MLCLSGFELYSRWVPLITGDLNLDRLRPDRREGKILLDLEEVHNLQCLIIKPTRITKTSETLLDVILTKLEIFRQCGVINPEISDRILLRPVHKISVSTQAKDHISQEP